MRVIRECHTMSGATVHVTAHGGGSFEIRPGTHLARAPINTSCEPCPEDGLILTHRQIC